MKQHGLSIVEQQEASVLVLLLGNMPIIHIRIIRITSVMVNNNAKRAVSASGLSWICAPLSLGMSILPLESVKCKLLASQDMQWVDHKQKQS